MSGAQLTLGAFNMSQPDGSTRVLADGTSRGNPVPLEVTVKSWLQDGAIVVTQGHDIRELSVRVRFYGSDLNALNALEAALFAELEKPNTLTWTPVSGPASVFVVVTSSLDFDETDDEGEGLPNPWRTYKVRLLCEAFPRSTAEVVSVGLPTTGATTTTLDTAGATTGWTGFVDGASSTVTANVGPPTTVSVTATSGTSVIALQKTFAATTTTTKLLVVDWRVTPLTGWSDLNAIGDGVALPLVARIASPTAGYMRSYYNVAASSLAITRFEMTPSGSSGGVARTVAIDNVAVTNAPPTIGSSRQQVRSLKVVGSARAPGSLAIESPTVALGDSLIYVYPNTNDALGYSPPLRQYRSSGNTVTPGASMVSGSSEPLSGGGVVFGILANQLPAGNYVLMGRLAATSAAAYTISTASATYFGATNTGTVTTPVTLNLTTTMANYVLGRLTLPVTDFDSGSSASTGLIISGSTAVTYDDFWLFNTTIGALTWVDCGTGTAAAGGPARRVFIDAPTVTVPRPVVRVAHSADRSDAFYPRGALKSWQLPQFPPSGVNVLAVTPNATDAVISLHHYPRWHTNASS